MVRSGRSHHAEIASATSATSATPRPATTRYTGCPSRSIPLKLSRARHDPREESEPRRKDFVKSRRADLDRGAIIAVPPTHRTLETPDTTRHAPPVSLRLKIVLLNAAILAVALVAAIVAVAGLWAALGPFERAVEEEAHAVALAEQLGLQPAQADVIEAALTDARGAERDAAQTALFATGIPVALIALGGIVSAALALGFSRHLLRRLSALDRATTLVAAGDRSVRVPAEAQPHRGDELDSLIAAFNQMIEQLTRAEARAQEAEAARRHFFAGVSHDLRTPLTTVSGILESLRRDEWDDATRAEFLDVAHRESQRLSRLVSDLLDLSRLDGHAWTMEREPVDLPSLAHTLVADLSTPGGPLAGRDVRLSAADGSLAWGDELQLRRVLENLLVNAAKFSPAGTPIAIDAHPNAASGVVELAVSDRGPGIPPEDVARVFERFYRGARDNGDSGGIGLGLAVARGIVEAHGGRIWVDPTPAAGARFVLTVPLARPSDAAPRETPATLASVSSL